MKPIPEDNGDKKMSNKFIIGISDEFNREDVIKALQDYITASELLDEKDIKITVSKHDCNFCD